MTNHYDATTQEEMQDELALARYELIANKLIDQACADGLTWYDDGQHSAKIVYADGPYVIGDESDSVECEAREQAINTLIFEWLREDHAAADDCDPDDNNGDREPWDPCPAPGEANAFNATLTPAFLRALTQPATNKAFIHSRTHYAAAIQLVAAAHANPGKRQYDGSHFANVGFDGDLVVAEYTGRCHQPDTDIDAADLLVDAWLREEAERVVARAELIHLIPQYDDHHDTRVMYDPTSDEYSIAGSDDWTNPNGVIVRTFTAARTELLKRWKVEALEPN